MKLKNILLFLVAVVIAGYAGYFFASSGGIQEGVETLPGEVGQEISATREEAAVSSEAERKKVVSVYLQLEHSDPKKAAGAVTALTEKYGGYVENESYFRGDDFTPETVSLTLRIPETRLEEALDELKKAGRVLNFNRSSEDVTDFFNETEITLKNKYAELDRLEELFNRAGSVSEILEVERELARVRSEIDNLENTLRRLEGQVKYATVQVQIQAPPAVSYRFSFVRDAMQVLLNNLFAGVRFVFALIGALAAPGALAVLIWGVYRLIKKK